MNLLVMLTPVFLGTFVVLQGGLNRKIAAQWGLSTAVLMNAMVLLILALLLYSINYFKPELLSESLKSQFDRKNFQVWFLFPGALGLALVLGVPWSISQKGAIYTFILLISSQLLMTLIWDMKVEGASISMMKWAGVLLAWIGALLVTLG